MKKILLLLASFNLFAVEYAEINAALDLGQTKKAEQLLNQLPKSSPDYNKYYFVKAVIEFQNNKLDDAEDYLEKALKSYPTAETYNLAGGIYGMQAKEASIFSKLGYAKKSKKFLQKAYEADPTNVDYIDGLIQFNMQAPSIAGGDSDAIEPLLKEMEKLDKKKAVQMRAQYIAEEDDEDAALEYINDEISKDPLDMDYKFYKGYLLSTMDRFNDAIVEYQKVINSESIEANLSARKSSLYQFGRLASIEKKWLKKGEMYFEEYLALESNKNTSSKAWATYRLGLVYNHMKDATKAQALFNKAMDLGPEEKLKDLIEDELN